MRYAHHWLGDVACDYPLGKAVCVGRNYAAHAKELNNPIPTTPILFLKPATSIVPLSPSISIPGNRGECHHELEVSLLIGERLTNANEPDALAAIAGGGLGLDLTLRDLQQTLKNEGKPWELAKAFDGALPLTNFIRRAQLQDLRELEFSLEVNGTVRQQGKTSEMLTPIPALLAYISQHFTLMPGDIVMTGTPAGVAKLQAGDRLVLRLLDQEFFTEVQVDERA